MISFWDKVFLTLLLVVSAVVIPPIALLAVKAALGSGIVLLLVAVSFSLAIYLGAQAMAVIWNMRVPEEAAEDGDMVK